MRSELRLSVLVVVACVGGILAVAAAKDAPSARKGMERIVAVAKKPKSDLFDVVLPGKLVKSRWRWKAKDVGAWRHAYAAELAKLGSYDVKASGSHAVVTWSQGNTKRAIRIRLDGDRWIVDCAQTYVVSGPILRRARGSRVGHVVLEARMDDKSGTDHVCYGKSSWSFEYVTGRPDVCRDRMSLWFDKYGNLCACHDNEIAKWGRTSLSEVKGLRIGLKFWRYVEPRVGMVYVLHTDRMSDKHPADFYVKLKVTKVTRRSLEFDWDLLAAGPGAPKSIHERVPLARPQYGGDGADGMYGGKMRPH